MAPTLIVSTGMRQAQQLLIPVSTGELVDKITILEIKKRKIKQAEALKNVSTELQLLQDIFNSLAQNFTKDENAKNDEIKRDLEKINLQLWDIEDALRSHEAKQYFGPEFIRLARSESKTKALDQHLMQFKPYRRKKLHLKQAGIARIKYQKLAFRYQRTIDRYHKGY